MSESRAIARPSGTGTCAEATAVGNIDPDRLLDSIRSTEIQHFGRPLREHLRGTFDLLVQWRNPYHVCLAGLLHSVYGTKTFTCAALGLEARARVQEMIGADAEQLVYLFCISDRRRLLLENRQPPYRWTDHRSGEHHPLAPEVLRSLAEIEAANFLEQIHLVDSAEILADMQARFESVGHLLSEPAKRALLIHG